VTPITCHPETAGEKKLKKKKEKVTLNAGETHPQGGKVRENESQILHVNYKRKKKYR